MSKRHKKPEKEGNHERWLISYADFITLLFAVFVTLYAMSQTDKRKTDQLVASLRESFGYVKTGASSEKLNVTDSTDLTDHSRHPPGNSHSRPAALPDSERRSLTPR